jgi:hypothetical protein
MSVEVEGLLHELQPSILARDECTRGALVEMIEEGEFEVRPTSPPLEPFRLWVQLLVVDPRDSAAAAVQAL